MLKLIVFDCDGVLFDSRAANEAFYNDMLAAFSCPPMSREELDFVHMHNVVDSVQHIFRHYPRIEQGAVERYRAGIDYGRFLKYLNMEEGLVEFLEMARQRCRLAISTNRTNTMRSLLAAYRLTDYFDMVVTAADVKNPKPAPDALLAILAAFDCRPEEALFIGDSILDQHHAAGCEVPFIAFKNSELTADYHVNGFADLGNLAVIKASLC
jgi:phosphoglycolate phosphatase